MATRQPHRRELPVRARRGGPAIEPLAHRGNRSWIVVVLQAEGLDEQVRTPQRRRAEQRVLAGTFGLERPDRHQRDRRRLVGLRGRVARRQRGVDERAAEGGAEVIDDLVEAVAGQRRVELGGQEEAAVAQRGEDAAQPPLLEGSHVDGLAERRGVEAIGERHGGRPHVRPVARRVHGRKLQSRSGCGSPPSGAQA